MAKLNIPPPYKRGLTVIKDLDQPSFREFISVLANSKSILHLTDAAHSAVNLSSDAVDLLLESLFALQLVRLANERGIADFIQDVMAELEIGKDPIALADPAHREEFLERLNQLFSIESVAVHAKARDLQLEHPHLYVNGRIITDLRPVFKDGPQESPSAMVLFHTLKLTYFDREHDGQRSTFYVALDEDDIAALKKLLERAETKSRTLRSNLQKAGISCLAET